jgi:hypothetical protein
MKKLAIICNSHGGAIKEAWDAISPSQPNLKIDFFVQRNIGKHPLLLISPNNKHVESITDIMTYYPDDGVCNIEDYDSFAVVGLGFGIHHILRTYRLYRSETHQILKGTHILSYDCFQASIAGFLNSSTAIKVINVLEKATNSPIYYIPEPAINETVFDGVYEKAYKYALDSNDSAALRDSYLIELKNSLKRAKLLDQDEITLINNIFTKKNYALTRDQSHLHMNEKYGDITLKNLIKNI